MKTSRKMLNKTFQRIIAYSLITAMFLTQFSGMNIGIVQAAEQTESQTMPDSNVSSEVETEASTKAEEAETAPVTEAIPETVIETQQEESEEPETDSESDTTAETMPAEESEEPTSSAETEPEKLSRGRQPRARDITEYFEILDYKITNRRDVETTEFEEGDQMRAYVKVGTKPGVEYNFSIGDTIVVPLPILPHFEFGGSGVLEGGYFAYEVVDDKLVFIALEAAALSEANFLADLHFNGTAKKSGTGIDAGGRPSDYPGGLTINPAPEAPPTYVDNNVPFPDEAKDLVKRGKQWNNGGNVISWSGQVNYRGLSDLFEGTSSNRSNSLIVDHLTPGTTFRPDSLYVTVPCFIGNNAGVMGERQIGTAKLEDGNGNSIDQPTNFADPIIHDYRTVGFTLLEQGDMTYEQFLAAVQDYPSQHNGDRAYGVYTHADETQTVLIAFGDLPGNTHYYDELTKNFVPPYNDIDIFEAIRLDKTLSQEQRNQLYDIYSRSGPSGGAITAYNFGFDVDVDVPEYGSGIYENEMDYLSDEKDEKANAEVDFAAEWGSSSAGFLQLKKQVYGSGPLESPRDFEFQIKDDEGTIVAYGKTNQQVTQKGQEVGITFYKKYENGTYSEPINNIDKDAPNHWSKILTVDKWYYIEEINAGGYDVSIVLSKNDEESNRFMYKPGLEQRWSFAVVNRESTLTIEGTKTWIDADDQDGIRPDSITVELYADDEKVDSKTVSAAEQWKYSFDNLPKYNQSGAEIVYRIDEVAVSGYEKTIDGYNLTNTHTPEVTTLKVVKNWVDDGNRDGNRPDSISVDLLADGSILTGKRETLNSDNSWTHTWTGLPKNKNGSEIVYTVQENDVPNGYVVTSNTTGNPATVTITNTYEIEKTSVSGTKSWNDADDQDGKRPNSITVNLYADNVKIDSKEVKASDNWEYSFTDLPKYKEGGTPIVYTIDEEAVDGYTKVINGTDITNTYTPEQTTLTVKKVWADNENQDGRRPADINVELLADGEVVAGKRETLSSGNDWTYVWTGLPKKANGTDIVYAARESGVPSGYTVTTDNGSTGMVTITNTYEPEKTSISGTKTWDDRDNQDNKRPTSIVVNLLADGVKVASKEVKASDNWQFSFNDLPKYKGGVAIVYTVDEELVPGYTKDIVGTNITNRYTPEETTLTVTKVWEDNGNQDAKRPASIDVDLLADGDVVQGQRKTLSNGNSWNYTWNGLPKKKNGIDIVYSAKEVTVPDGYTVTTNTDAAGAVTITNSYTPEVITVSGTKTWNDANNQDGKRPANITVNLYADNNLVASKQVSERDGWQYSFTNLPKYRAEGIPIIYRIDEDVVDGYSKEVTGTNITNTYTPEETTLTVTKVWVDNDNQDGKRPNDIDVELLAGGNVVAGKRTTLSEGNGWTHTWTGLPKKANGTDIIYSARESGVPNDYESVKDETTTSGTVTITNSYTPEKTRVFGSKTWDDANDQDGKRPTSITVRLYADNVEVDHKTVTADENWQYSFDNLPKYHNGGVLINYTVIEDVVTDYSQVVNGANITNRYTPEETTLTVTKVWDDSENQDGKRPDSILVDLLADGTAIGSKRVILDSDNNWTHTWTGLPKKANKTDIVYTAEEVETPSGYTVTTDDRTNPGTVKITNSYTPEKITVSGTKIWDDANDQDGKRPTSIMVKLYADNVEIDSKEIKAEHNWKYEFTNLPKFHNGVVINYRVDEVDITDYSKVVSGYDITNRYTPEETTLTVSKVWSDSNNQDGLRPESINVELTADGNVVAGTRVPLSSSNGWTHTWTGLAKKSGGREIVYSAKESGVPSGYASVISSASAGAVTITNSYTPEQTAVYGTKTWNDANNQDGKRPPFITVNLYADGTKIDSTTVTAVNNWRYSFTGLPKYRTAGIAVVYTVDEDPITDYTSEVNGTNITNSYVPEETTLTVTKVWDDQNNQDGKRPPNILVDLLADGTAVSTRRVTLNSENRWTYTWTGLPKKSTGSDIVYTAEEVGTPDGYTVTTGNPVSGTVKITNSYIPETVNIAGSKTWEDANNQDGKRPSSIIVNLYADGTKIDSKEIDVDDSWQYSFNNLPKYRDQGAVIVYRIDEEPVAGYTKEVNGTNLTNRYTPEKISVSGTKTWNDANNQDGKRPTSINVNLYADGTKIASKEVKAENGWQYSFTDLPKYRDEGIEIAYTIDEDAVADYSKEVTGHDITNTYTPEQTTLTVRKIWEDSDDQDGKRPPNITVDLLADNQIVTGKQVRLSDSNNWTYTWTGLPKKKNGTDINYSAKENGVPNGYRVTTDESNEGSVEITNSYTTETISVSGTKIWDDANNQDGKRPTSITVNLYADNVKIDSKVVDADENWQYTFTNLPKYRDHGTLIQYRVDEETVTDYTQNVSGYDITNTYTPEETTLSVSKVWEDNNDQDGKRPISITVDLLADGTVLTGKRITLSNGNSWSHTWTGLPRKANGTDIVYSVRENEVPPEYASTQAEDSPGTVTITNSYTPEKTSVSGTKTWDDANNQDGKRPNSITVKLLADNVEVAEKVVTAANEWKYSFTDLPKYRDSGNLIIYTIDESAVPGYSKDVTGTNITNRYTPEETTLTVTKVWSDANNQDGKRPLDITVDLTADGSVVAGKRATLNEDNNWTYTWTGLPKKSDGAEIVYGAKENGLPSGYTAVSDDSNTGNVTITNTYTPEITSVRGTKSWDDSNNQDGKRPTEITVNLYADNVKVDSQQVSAASNWQYSFTGLPKFKNGGELIIYTVDEEAISGYTKEVVGNNIINHYRPEETTLTVNKVWDDSNNQDNKRPPNITVVLNADGTPMASRQATLNIGNNWSYTWTGLPRKANGTDIVYTVTESGIPGDYTVTTDAATTPGVVTLTNSYEPETIEISGTKTWEDAGNQDGKRPDMIKVNLYADDVKIDTKDVTVDENWQYSFTGLPKYRNQGVQIVYRIDEEPVADYQKVINGTNLTNRYTPETVSVSGTKTWDDANNQDGKRPTAITVNLLADGTKIDSREVKADNGWQYSFTNLPKYKDAGTEIVYTIDEEPVTGYDKEVNGTNITNRYTPEETTLKVTKVWNDRGNQDGKRPDDITVNLLADGNIVTGKQITLTKNGGWTYTWSGLPKKNNGTDIIYTAAEAGVPSGYTVTTDDTTTPGEVEITNSYTPETIEVSGTKTWDDANNQDGKRPTQIKVNLYADNVLTDSRTVTVTDNWQYSFTNLPKYRDQGTEIVYTVDEEAVLDYSKDVNGYDITNRYTPEETTLTVTKVWNDNNDQDGHRPGSITADLLLGGIVVPGKRVTLDSSNNWSHTWTGLPKKANGIDLIYSAKENEVPSHYTSSKNEEISGTVTITNTYIPEKTSIAGTKTWDDANNQDGKRPASITVNLYADGTKVDSKVVDEAAAWRYNFTDLPKYRDSGTLIAYTVDEEAVDDYSKEISGTNINNRYTPEKTTLTVRKVWSDNNDQDGNRPNSISVDLLADGTPVSGKRIILNENNGWTYTWTGLAKKKNAVDIVYSAAESETPTGYTVTTDTATTPGTVVITNSYTPETINISGTKTWDDDDDRDAKRPTEITVKLSADNVLIDSKTVTEAENWQYQFTGLPKYKNGGTPIIYTIDEDAITDYSKDINGADITNRYTPEETTLTVSKVWNDNNNQDGRRPTSITVDLLANGNAITSKRVTLSDDNNWTATWTGLPKKENGAVITYSAEEVEVPSGYTVTTDDTTTPGTVTITNSYTPETTVVAGTKSWNDNNDQDGKRPDEITVNLLADNQLIDSKQVTAANGWQYEFANLPKYRAVGIPIVYTVDEEAVDGYSKQINGTNIINSYTPEETTLTVKKVWNDNDNQDGKRPANILVKLMADGTEVDGKRWTLSSANSWTYTWSELPKKANGVDIVYTAEEVLAPEGYTVTTDDTTNPGTVTITNSYTPETIVVAGTKSWNDNNDQDGKRPDEITVNLLADNELIDSKQVTAANGWQYEFTNLPKYRAVGIPIIYTVDEEAVDGYSKEVNGTNITNRYTPEETTLTVNKVWDDRNNQDGKRPLGISVDLLADGTKITSERKVLNNSNNWTHTWTGLPKKANGVDIVYTAEEVGAPSGYTVTTDTTTNPGTVTITNSYTPETTEVAGTKSWNDNNDQDGKRPDEITVNLLADNQLIDSTQVTAANGWQYEFTNLPKYRAVGIPIIYTVDEEVVDGYSKEVNGTNITNSYTPEETTLTVKKVWNDNDDQDGKRPADILVKLMADGTEVNGKRMTLSSGNSWTYTWTGLPKKANAVDIVYSAEEVAAPNGYTVVTDDTTNPGEVTITNSYTPEITSVSGTKSWDDSNDQDGKRPNSIIVKLYADNVEIDSKTVTADDNWEYEFTGLPKYRDVGTLIAYRVDEDIVDDYSKEITGTNITNRYTPEETTLTVSKVWNDNNNQDGTRPTSILVDLLADGSPVSGKRITLSSTNNWTHTWSGLAKKKNAVDIVYSAAEVETPNGYTVTTDDTTTPGTVTITNSHTPEVTTVSGSKSWDDDGDRDGKRPTSIIVKLYADNIEIDSKTVTATDNWEYEFTDLPKYRDAGTLIAYRVDEEIVDDYSKEVNGYNITNRYTPEETTLTVSKVWDDSNNLDGNRPDAISVDLTANGNVVGGKRISLNEANNWTYTWTALPKKENAVDIFYSARESGLPSGYTVTTDDTTTPGNVVITNSYTPEKISVTGTKIWDDSNNQDNKRPDQITVKLYADNIEIDSKTVTAAENWEYQFDNLSRYRDQGIEIAYRVDENPVDGYSKEVNGYNITNRYTPEETTLTVAKIWDDNNNQDGKRPARISVALYADGTEIPGKIAVINERGGWTYTWTALPKFNNGTEIVYTAKEVDVPEGYTEVIDTTTTPGTVTITNSHTPELTNVNGTKTWSDDNNKAGKRPEKIVVELFADGRKVTSKEVTAAEEWKYSFTDLPKYEGGAEIIYHIDEQAVAEYRKEVKGYDITNHYEVKPFNLLLRKTDPLGNSLAGAEFTLTDSAGNVVTLISGSDGTQTFSVKEGAYTLVETKAPVDFERLSTPINFTVDADGKAQLTGQASNLVRVSTDGLELLVINRRFTDGNDQDDTEPYTETETETDSSTTVQTDTNKTITRNNTTVINRTNSTPRTGSSPKTGDNTEILFYLFLVLGAGTLLFIVSVSKKRAKQKVK